MHKESLICMVLCIGRPSKRLPKNFKKFWLLFGPSTLEACLSVLVCVSARLCAFEHKLKHGTLMIVAWFWLMHFACGSDLVNTFSKKKSYFFAKSGRGGVNGLKNVHFLALLGRFLFWSETSPRGCADPIYAFWAEIGRTLVGSKKSGFGASSDTARDCYYEEEKKWIIELIRIFKFEFFFMTNFNWHSSRYGLGLTASQC